MQSQESTPESPRLARAAIGWGLAGGLTAIVVVAIWTLFHHYQVYDDAHFYTRYARNLLETGAVTWNPGGRPDFGPTSPAYVFVVAPFVAAFGDTPMLVILAASVTCALAFVLAILVLVLRTAPSGCRGPAAMLVLFSVAAAAPSFGQLATSGMDTALAMLWATLLIGALAACGNRPSRARTVLAGVVGGLAFSVRADLLLFTFGVPAVCAVLAPDARARRTWIAVAAIAGVVLAAQLGLAWLYFGRPLPLSFYAKSTRYFSDAMYAQFTDTPTHELARFGWSYRFLFAVVAVELVLSPRRWWRATSPVEKGVAAAAAVFGIYYLGFVLQMLGNNSRFYYPTLPALAWVAALSLARLGAPIFERTRLIPARTLALAAALVLLAAAPSLREALDHEPLKRADALARGRFDFVASFSAIENPAVWFGIAAISKLPEDVVLATTEVGIPGVLSPHQTVVDLSGLNDGAILDAGTFDGDALLTSRAPDVIWMPYPTYAHIDRALRESPVFQTEYEVADEIGFGFAIRRSSRHYAAIRALVDSR